MGNIIAFDLGNVLFHFDITKFTSKLSEITGLSSDESFFFLSHIQHAQDLGITNVLQSLKYKFANELTEQDYQILLMAWTSTISPNKKMIKLLERIKLQNCKVAFLSNMGPEHIFYLRTKYPKIFENVIQHISCEVGARKPQKLFFQSFVMDHQQSNIFYIDDLQENLDMAMNYGIKTYKFALDKIQNEKMLNAKDLTEDWNILQLKETIQNFIFCNSPIKKILGILG